MDVANVGKLAKKWAIRVVLGAVVLCILGVVVYTYATLHYVYSSGERVGFVQKLSKKGWLCKTNEGELAMVNVAGQQAELFAFTVPDDDVVKQIESHSGHRVVLKYQEHVGIPSSCFGDTKYFVIAVEATQ